LITVNIRHSYKGLPGELSCASAIPVAVSSYMSKSKALKFFGYLAASSGV